MDFRVVMAMFFEIPLFLLTLYVDIPTQHINHIRLQWRVRGGAPGYREEHQDRVRRQVHQEEEGGDQPPRRRHEGHREGD